MINKLPAIEGGMPTRKKFLVFGKPEIKKEDIKEVVDSLKIGWLGTGPKVAKFEELIKKYTNAKYAIAVNSCTAGLHLALIACGVKPGDEVITTPMTFAATANVIEHMGAVPVFVDIDTLTMNIDPTKIEEKITKKTKAIILVHMAGLPCDIDSVKEIARKYKLTLIEDAAHALGAKYKGKKIGNVGDITVFSFYATKNLTTGEGGMVMTNNKKCAKKIRLYSLHGLNKDAWKRYSEEAFKHYLVQVPGYKYNMMDLQAAIGIHQIERFDKNQEKRKKIWKIYNEAFRDLPLNILAEPPEEMIHAHHLYTLILDLKALKVDRDVIINAIQEEGIGVGIHFIAVHLHPFYKDKYGYKRGDFPNAEYISDRTISIPLSPAMNLKDINDVISAIRKVLLYFQGNQYVSKNKRLASVNDMLKSMKY